MSQADESQQAAVEQQQALAGQAAAPLSEDDRQHAKAAGDFSQNDDKKRSTMHVKIYSPSQSYFDGQAVSISAENATGPFDVLPRHHSFISLLSPCELVIRSTRGEDKHIKISGGIMHVKANYVIVFLDI